MVVNIYSSLRGAQLCSRAGEAEVKRETPSLPFGSDTWDVEQRDVQEALLVAEYKTGQREAEAKPWAAVHFVKEFGPWPVGSRSLGTVWRIHLKGSNLKAGNPARRELRP